VSERRPLFIAFEFPDPWASRMLDVDEDIEELCRRLNASGATTTAHGPVIYLCDEDEDPARSGLPVARWIGAADLELIDPKHQGRDKLMSSAADFVLEFFGAYLQRMRKANRLDQDDCWEDDASGHGDGDDRDGEGGGPKRVRPAFFDLP
jgi:hypothetical protein